MAIILPYHQWKSWRERVRYVEHLSIGGRELWLLRGSCPPFCAHYRHFTWSWHAVIMGTGVVSALLHLFPYNNDSQALKIMALIFFLLNLVLFVFVCTCTVLRYIMFPEVSAFSS